MAARVDERVAGERRSWKVLEEGWIVERNVRVLLDRKQSVIDYRCS